MKMSSCRQKKQNPNNNPNKHLHHPPQKNPSALFFSSLAISKEKIILKLSLEFSQAVKIQLFLMY